MEAVARLHENSHTFSLGDLDCGRDELLAFGDNVDGARLRRLHGGGAVGTGRSREKARSHA